MTRRREQPGPFPIALILEELGAVDVPRVRDGYAKLLCPFHPDSTPSACVSAYGFVCWACDITGDAISLLRRFEGPMTFADAVARAAEITGVTSSGIRGEPPPRPTLLEF